MSFRVALAFLCLITGRFAVANSPGSGVVFTPLSAFHSKSNPKWGTVLTDIMNHEAPGDSNHYSDLITLAHETTHGIQAYLRNHNAIAGKTLNAFYVLEDRAVIVPEPNIRKSQVAKYVPVSLRGFRYSTYVTGQTAWDSTPLYLWDEWNAYANGGEAGVDLVQNGLWHGGWRDGVAGQLEFSVYALASAMAVKKIDPTYFTSESQFTEFLAWNLKRSMATYTVGALLKDFKWDDQEKYLEKLRTSSDAESLRQFTRDTFGDTFAKDVFGF